MTTTNTLIQFKENLMTTFKYQVTWFSFWVNPQVFVTNSLEDVKVLKEEGINNQYKVQVLEGDFDIYN